MSGLWDWFRKEMVIGTVEARYVSGHEDTEAQARLAPDLQKALQKLEVAEEFFERVGKKTHDFHVRYRSNPVPPFGMPVDSLAEAGAHARKARDLLTGIKSGVPWSIWWKYSGPAPAKTWLKPLRLTPDQESFLKKELEWLRKDLKEELVYVVYSLETFRDHLRRLEIHDEDFGRFRNSLEPFVASEFSGEGGGEFGGRDLYLLTKRLREGYEQRDYEMRQARLEMSNSAKKKSNRVHQRTTNPQKSKSRHPGAERNEKEYERLERLEQSNREILKELEEAKKARDRAERREFFEKNPDLKWLRWFGQ